MTTPPLSPAAQAVFDAFVAEARPEPHHQREAIAAAIRALVAATLPREQLHPPFDVPVWPERAQARRDLNSAIWARQEVRAKQLGIAAELDGGAGALTRTMVVCPICGNKRCPHATDPALACTGSNEPGQPGSIYTTHPTETP